MAAGEGRTSNAGERGRQRRLKEVDGKKEKTDEEVERGAEGGRGADTYPALLLSSCQPLDWSVLGWARRSRWGRATQNHTPVGGFLEQGGEEEKEGVEGGEGEGGEVRKEEKQTRRASKKAAEEEEKARILELNRK